MSETTGAPAQGTNSGQLFPIDLQVKALAQPLGCENAWNELGDGRVEFHGYTIRVVTYPSASLQVPSTASEQADAVSSSEPSPTSVDRNSTSADEAAACPQVILEDVINDETPFVGENSCIVWNSLDQELSLCMMFATDVAFQAAWSALAAVQHKAFPPLGADLFETCRLQTDDSTAGADDKSSARDAVPYCDVLHFNYSPSVGMIERHAFAVSLMEHGHLHRSELYKDVDTCHNLLRLGQADLIEHLAAPAVYPLFLKGLDANAVPPRTWQIPHGLSHTLRTSKELEGILNTATCLHHLKHDVLPLGTEEEAVPVIDSVIHRLLNEAACTLLADDALLKTAVDELDVLPVPEDGNTPLSRSTTPTEAAPAAPGIGDAAPTATAKKEMSCAEAERHVADHLRFFTSIISLSITAFSKELVAPVMGKIFSHGLLVTLARVAERFTQPQYALLASDSARLSNQSSTSRQVSPENNTSSRPSSSSTSKAPAPPVNKEGSRRPPRSNRAKQPQLMYSSLVEDELAALLDATLVRLNERQEEVAINDFFRGPILDNPQQYAGLLSFLVRQLQRTCGKAVSKEQLASASLQRLSALVPWEKRFDDISHRYLLYHLLGMHDDEGSSSSERALDADNTSRRNEFHAFMIRQFIGPACAHQKYRGACDAASAITGAPIITPPLIRVIEYLLRLASADNRRLLLLRLFDVNSHVFDSVEESFRAACQSHRFVGHEVLCGHLRFLKSLLLCVTAPQQFAVTPSNNNPLLDVATTHECGSSMDDSTTSLGAPPPAPEAVTREESNKVFSLAAKALTLDRQVFALVLDVYHAFGGGRRAGLLHCTARSLFHCLLNVRSPLADNMILFLLLKYRSRLPPTFVSGAEKRMLDDVTEKLDVHAVVGRRRDSVSPALINGVSHIDISVPTSLSPAQSPPGRHLSVDEVGSPPDAKNMEDIAAFPRRLRQAIGRLSPTPRMAQAEDDAAPRSGSASPTSQLHLLPLPRGGTSPNPGALCIPVAQAMSPKPPVMLEPLEAPAVEDVPPPVVNAETTGGPSSPTNAKPSAPKQAKGAAPNGRGRQLGDGKPLMRSK